MKTIIYTFADGTACEHEVSDELGAAIAEMETQERRNNKRETRRHTSLDYLNDKGIDFADGGDDMLTALIAQEEKEEFAAILLSALTPKQVEVYMLRVFEEMTEAEIASVKGISQPAISQQLATILRKLKNFSENLIKNPSVVGIGRGIKIAYFKLRG